MLFAILSGVLVCGAAGAWAVRRGRPAAETVRHTRCPKCALKLRFPAAQAGRGSMCPNCMHQWTIPAATAHAAAR